MEGIVFAVGTQENWEEEAGKKAEITRELLEKYGKKLTTDQDGKAELENLKKNSTYYVTELQTREGYQLDETIYTFQIDENGWIQGKSVYTLKLVNEKKPETHKPESPREEKPASDKKEEVKTGDESSLAIWGIMAGFSIAALVLLAGKQRKNRK